MKTIKHSLCLSVSMIGAAVIWGWAEGTTWLTNISPHLPSMKISTAICFIFAGLLTYLLRSNGVGPKSQVFGSAVTFGIMLFMGGMAVADLLGVRSGIENLFVLDHSTELSPRPGMPALGTMMAFILISSAGIAWIFERRELVAPLYCMVMLIGSVSLAGYAFNRPSLYFFEVGRNNAMAIHAAAMFVALGICGCDKITLGKKHKGAR